MNKMDLFKEKVESVDLADAFPEYPGGKDVEKASKFLMDKYMGLNKNKERPVHVFCTTATESDSLKNVFMETKKLLLSLPTKKLEL